MTTATRQPDAQPSTRPLASEGYERLFKALDGSASLRSAYTTALSYIADEFSAPYAALTLDVDNGSIEHDAAANEDARNSWHRHCDGMMLSSRYHQTCQARFFHAEGVDGKFAVLSVPLSNESDGGVGAISLVIRSNSREATSARLSELHVVAMLVDLQAENARRRGKTAAASTTALSKIASYESLQHFCFDLTNSLKTNMACDQVALGLVRGSSIKVACISGFDDLYPKTSGTRTIQQAMCECLDVGTIICHQADSGGEVVLTGHRLHMQWYASVGACPVASIPLFLDQECVAVISLRNAEGSPFKQKQLSKAQELVTPMLPCMRLLERADHTTLQRANEAMRTSFGRLFEPGQIQRRLMFAVLASLVAWVAFAKTEYRFSAPCTVQASDDLELSAPFEGSLAAAYVRLGEEVEAGQLIARMDSRALEAEREKLLADLRVAKVNTIRASQSGEITEAARARATAAAAESQLRGIDQKLAASEIRAPTDGVIVEGNLQRKVGEVMPLGELLVRFAPRGQWRVDVHVPEHAVADLRHGQTAAFAATARPEMALDAEIVQVHAASSIENGSIAFNAEAKLVSSPPPWLRAGMRGVARVEVGRRPVWWVWAHRAFDSVRLQLWRL